MYEKAYFCRHWKIVSLLLFFFVGVDHHIQSYQRGHMTKDDDITGAEPLHDSDYPGLHHITLILSVFNLRIVIFCKKIHL